MIIPLVARHAPKTAPHAATAHFFAGKGGGLVVLGVALVTVGAVLVLAGQGRKAFAAILGTFMLVAVGVVVRAPAFAHDTLRARELAAAALWLPIFAVAVISAVRSRGSGSARGGGYSPAYRSY